MSRQRRRDALEPAIEETFAPGDFIDYRAHWDFVSGLEAIRSQITALGKAGDPTRAVRLLEALIAACYAKTEEVDDSGGSFGIFVEGLFGDWLEARQASKADPDETSRMLLSWIETDDYGYCDGVATGVAKVLDRPGLAAFERAVRA